MEQDSWQKKARSRTDLMSLLRYLSIKTSSTATYPQNYQQILASMMKHMTQQGFYVAHGSTTKVLLEAIAHGILEGTK